MSDSNTPAFNKAQKKLVIKAMLRHLGDVQAIRLDEYLTDGLTAVYVDLIEQILAVLTVKAKRDLVASFLDGYGKPFGATLEQVEAAFAKGKVPPTFVVRNHRQVRIAPFAALQECDLLGSFRAEMERRAAIADSAPEASADGAAEKVG